MLKRFFSILSVILALSTPPVFAANYAIDQDHSTISFKIKHLFSWVRGTFDAFEGNFVYDAADPASWTVSAVIKSDSINTNVRERDSHLRSKDFFDTASFPEITFRSTAVTEVTPESAKLEGVLQIHGVEKPVTLDLEIHGEGPDPWGNYKSGFTATTVVNRKDFGLAWNEVLETGQLLVGEEVFITIEIEGTKE